MPGTPSAPELTTTRLRLPDPPLVEGSLALRSWRLADAPALAEAWADPDIRRFTAVPVDASLTAARRWIVGGPRRLEHQTALDLVIALDGAPAGEIGLSHVDEDRQAAMVGYWVAPRWRGAGIARRALTLFTGWALEALDLQALVARCHPDNLASIAVARAGGYVTLGEDAQGWVVLAARRAAFPADGQ